MSLAIPATGRWAITRHSIDNFCDGWIAPQNTNGNNSTAWGTQYRAIYCPVRVPRRVVVKKLGYVANTTATGNIDIGIYDAAGNRLVSSGSTAKSGTAAIHAIDITDTTIGPGLYYIALNNDTTTDTFLAQQNDAAPVPASRGYLTETLGSVTLPETASWAVPQTLAMYPAVAMLLVTEVS